MSKEARAAAYSDIMEAVRNHQPNVALGAALVLVDFGLSSLERIADALEKRQTVAVMGEGMVVGDVAKFGPAFPPELLERLTVALESIAASTPEAREERARRRGGLGFSGEDDD